MLARLGVGRIYLIDNDTLAESNLNRVHGSRGSDIGTPKVDILKREIAAMGVECHVLTSKAWVKSVEVCDALKASDFIFGCTDDNSGRIFINRLAYFYGIPVIDVGLRMIAPTETYSADLNGRVTTVLPGRPCLICSGVVNAARANEEDLERTRPEEYQRRKDEAYVIGGGEPAPAVVTFTTEMASVAVDELIAGVQQSVEENAKSREQINGLEQVSRRIDKIVDAITTVSIQTNMLAVNGAIEAARAGEFGKGFMVVSTDIRNLARDSSENAERIKDLVKSVQDQIVAVRRDLEETATLAATEVEKNKAVTTNLASIETDMGAVLDGNRVISKGAAEILEALQEAKRGVEQIATAATQASQAANQASQAAREQAKGAEELASAVEEIASLADELQNSDAG